MSEFTNRMLEFIKGSWLFIKGGWLLDYAFLYKIEIISILFLGILLLGFFFIMLVVIHIAHKFIKKYFPRWRKRNFFWIKQKVLRIQVNLCRAWCRRRSFLEGALCFARRKLSCAVGSMKSKWNKMLFRKREISFLWRISKYKTSGLLSEIQSLYYDLKNWFQNNSPDKSLKLPPWLLLALKETIRVFSLTVLRGALSVFVLAFAAGFTVVFALFHVIYSIIAVLAISLIAAAAISLSAIAVFLFLLFSMPLLIVMLFRGLLLGLQLMLLKFLKATSRCFRLVFGHRIGEGIELNELLTLAASLVGIMVSFMGVVDTLQPKPPSQNIFNAYNRVSNGSTVKTDLKSELTALTAAIKQLNNKTELKVLQNAINDLKGQIETVRGGPIQVKVESPTLQKELEDLQDAVNELGTQIEAIPKPPSSVELKGLQASLDGLKKQIEALRKDPIEVESSGLQKELKDLQVVLNGLKKQIGESQTADRAELQNLQNLQDAISDLKTQIKTMSKEELECLRKELAALNAQLKQPIVYKPWVIAKLVKGMAKLLGIGDRKQQNGRQQSPPCPA